MNRSTALVLALFSGLLFMFQSGCEETAAPTQPSSTEEVTVRGDSTHSLRVLAPNGGETYHVGDTLAVHMGQAESDYYVVMVALSIDNSRSWLSLTNESAVSIADQDTFRFVIPAVYETLVLEEGSLVMKEISLVSSTCLIQLSDYDDGETGIRDISDAPFAIEP